jgi:glutamyl/glutaminyl-tRNA synthetase
MSTNFSKTTIDLTVQNRLATLIQNISADFSLDKLSKSPARFNTEKLNWFNREYIKMLSLEEFALRSFKLKLNRKFPDSKLRIGDHVYLVDIDKQLVFCEVGGKTPGIEQPLHPVGGGRKDGDSSIQNLHKEVSEETNNQIKIDESKLLKITEFVLDEPFIQNREEGIEYTSKQAEAIKNHPKYFDGKDWTIYFYPVKIEDIQKNIEIDPDHGQENIFDWVKLQDLVGYNRYLTYPVYKQFCENNKIQCFEPTERIKTQYLAWNLDKVRVTTLDELGIESDCILKYEKPDQELVKWKKITSEESLANLLELLPILQGIYTKLETQRKELFEAQINELSNLHENLTQLWEDELKSWINQNSKDAGSYFWPLRTALSGRAKSPSPFEILVILSWEEVENRISSFLKLKN